jgi:carbamoyltransferase
MRAVETELTVGLAGEAGQACVALREGSRIVSVCEQERVTRVRGAGFNYTGMPDEALDLVLQRAGRSRTDISQFVFVEEDGRPKRKGETCIDHHRASASTSYLSSPFTSAAIVVCDRELPKVSVWQAKGSELIRVDWPWEGPGFSDLYTSCSRLLCFPAGGEQRFEALARLNPGHREKQIEKLLQMSEAGITVKDGWESWIEDTLHSRESDLEGRSRLAAALQNRIGELLLIFLARVREVTRAEHLCLGGSLFYHSSMNTLVRTSELFSRVFVPVNPGNAGLSVGLVLQEAGPRRLSPFLGPAYGTAEIKATLESCKLPYKHLVNDSDSINIAVEALKNGLLVGWYEGAMEWGPRALGARSILANPFAPYVLDNLNHFLKQRKPWRGYALSALPKVVDQYFSGPSESPFMECDFRARDAERFAHVLASPNASVRVQIVGADCPAGFKSLLEAFGNVTGIPCLVNTSFNGFHEPIVCTPRDAIRVFYGTGIDVLLLDRFVLTK